MASAGVDGSEPVEDPDVGFQTVMSPTTEEQTGDGVPDVSSLAYTYVFSTTDVVKLRSANLGWVSSGIDLLRMEGRAVFKNKKTSNTISERNQPAGPKLSDGLTLYY